MNTLLQDLRYSARMLYKKPGFTFIAVITLALGIGANTAIFSVVNATLLRPLPVANSEQLMYVFSGPPNAIYSSAASYPDYADFRDQTREIFDGLIARGAITVSLRSGDRVEQISGLVVSGNYFDTLGVRAVLGRTFSPEEDKTPNTHPVIVISHRFWQSRFSGRADVIGQPIVLNGQSFTIIGVAPAEFNGTENDRVNDLWAPLMMQAVVRPPRGGYSGEMNPDLLKVRGNRWLFLTGRLKPGVTREQAEAALNTVAERQAKDYPNTNANRIVKLTPVNAGDPEQSGRLFSVAGLLLGIVGIVLLIACANVANLLLVRASSRRREIAVRLAIGASRWRLLSQLLTESIMLALLGGTVGLLLAVWGTELLKVAPPPGGILPVRPQFGIDWRVLGFTLVLSVVTGIVFGLVPALQASRFDLVPALKDETLAIEGGRRRFNLRSALVIVQVASSLVLLIGAGLFMRSLWQAQAITPGFDAENVMTVPLNINLLRYTRTQGREFYRQTLERVGALPGVEAVSLARSVPLSGFSSVRGLMIEGQKGVDEVYRSEGGNNDGNNANVISVNTVTPNYFATMGIARVQGRDFDAQDTEEKPGVVIVNETFVKRHFRGEAPLGKRLSMRGQQGPWLEIVGVVRDSKYATIGETAMPYAYLPLAQNHETGMALMVRTAGNSVAAAVRNEVQSLERNLPLGNIALMTELIGGALYAARMGAVLIAVFGGIALVLAVIGLYGLLSFSIARRTKEIGVRMALGAQTGDVLKLVLREGMLLAAIGVALGLIVAAFATRVLTSYLYGISALDTTTFVSIPIVLFIAALVACYIPARRATKVDPLIALRYE